MSFRATLVVALAALAGCTREIPVDSPIRWIARADRVQLDSGERIQVDRVVARTLDTVTIESDGRRRQIAANEIDAVIAEDRARAGFLGAAAGAFIGGGLGFGYGIDRATTCTGDTDDDAIGELGCVVEVALWPLAGLVTGALIGSVLGGAIGATRTHTLVYRRRSPAFTLAPTADGASAVWSIEF